MSTAATYTLEIRHREGGAKLDRMFLTRDSGIVPTKLELPAHRYGIDALDFSVSDFITGQDLAAPYGNGIYYTMPESAPDALTTPDFNVGFGTGFFDVRRAGHYNVIGTVFAPNTSEASFWVSVDNGPFWKWTGIPTPGWRQQWVTDANNGNKIVDVSLAVGGHRIDVYNRESGARFNRFTIQHASP
jgi:hypothetical protein